MKTSTLPRLVTIALLLLIAMSIGGVYAAFVYSEQPVESAQGKASVGIDDFDYDTGNGTFSSQTEMLNYITSPENAEEVSGKYFDGSLNVSANADGSLKLTTPSNSKSVLFTAEFIYELQQLGIKTIVIDDFSVSGSFNNIYINYTDYTGASQGHYLGSVWEIDISSPSLSPSADGYVYTANGVTNTAGDIKLTTSWFSYSWTIGSMTFE